MGVLLKRHTLHELNISYVHIGRNQTSDLEED